MLTKKKVEAGKAAAGFLASIILVQLVLFLIGLVSLALPWLSDFFYAGGNPTLAFWVMLGIAGLIIIGSVWLIYQKRKSSYVSLVIAGALLGALLAVALMSVLLF